MVWIELNANSLHKLGAIDTLWGDGPTDGLGAMTAWVAHHEAALKNISMNYLIQIDSLFREI